MKHTKGPWIYDERVGCVAVYAGERRNCLSGISDSQDCIFYKHGTQEYDEDGNFKQWNNNETDLANALLIAAAPDLLAACKKALAIVKGQVLEHAVVSRENPNYSLGDMLREVIAKAEVPK